MTTLSSAQRIALYSQHYLTHDDWMNLCELAGFDEPSEQLASLTFEQFFGLAVHTFLTAEDAHVRQQLAALIPKFGSRAVLSLFKIVFHCAKKEESLQDELQSELGAIALKSLESIEPAAFVVGLENAILDPSAVALMPLMIEVLVDRVRGDDGELLTLLPRLLSTQSWQQLKHHLLNVPTFSAIQASIRMQNAAALTC